MECCLGREKFRSVFILLTWLQHGRRARVYGCRETWEDPKDRGAGAGGLVWMSRNVFYGAAFQKGIGESFPVAWDDRVAFLS